MAWGTVISWPYQGVSVRAWSSSTRAARSTSWNRGAPGVSSSSCRRGDGSWGRGSCSVGAPLPAASPPWPCAAPECCRAPRCTPAPAPPPRAQQHGLRSARRVHDAQAGVHQRRLRRQIAPPGPVPAAARRRRLHGQVRLRTRLTAPPETIYPAIPHIKASLLKRKKASLPVPERERPCSVLVYAPPGLCFLVDINGIFWALCRKIAQKSRL